MRLLVYGALILVLGCATTPREPYVWRDDKFRPVGVHRGDVARAEGRVIEYLASSGEVGYPDEGCESSARRYQVITVETDTAYEVRLVLRPGLCNQASENTSLPPTPWIYERPSEFAVSKKDFHIIRERSAGDEVIEDWAPYNPPPKWLLEGKENPGASALAFATPSLRIPVGDCAGPLRIETRTESGKPAEAAAAPITANLAANPPSAVFFSDATCATAVTGAEVKAGSNSAEVYFRATQVGPLRISAAAKGLSGVSQTHTVEPARAVALSFTTPPQTVASDACSGAVTLQSRDAFENPAKVQAATSIQLLATPARSVTLYAKPDCTGAAMTAAGIPADGDSATFYFKGRLARTVAIAATLGTASVSQDEVITPAQPARPSTPGQKGP